MASMEDTTRGIDDLIVESLDGLGRIFAIFSERKKRFDDIQTSRRHSLNRFDKIQTARRKAFAAALRKFASFIDEPSTEETREPYPTKWLRTKFTDPTTRKSEEDWLPLHWIVCDEAPAVSDVDALLDSIGWGAFDEDVSPFSVAVAKPVPSEAVISSILKFNAEAVSKPDKDGAMAMMYASAWNESEMTVHMIHDSCPEAIKKTDKYGFHAIHYASYVGNTDVISYLLQVNPDAIREANIYGTLPLCAAAVNFKSEPAMIQMMIELYPGAASVPDNEGSLPLHKAAQFASLAVLELLYKAFPEGAKFADGEGLLPMHYAAQRSRMRLDNMDVVQFLLDANPDNVVLNSSDAAELTQQHSGSKKDKKCTQS